ncbi:aldehyde:ferredoxin oxidoreductase [Desulfonatronum thiosulfatophilum]|uniref:Aldehyde:ferredoxin oxidoreductase n=1 Tax=Desulfonatronum thiosulfatophilum TaxID=617002 RepID=A0A1G6DCS6_9BACT|nr:aldehyde ferredoxin oxidoreductase C-terminal domain-containing protein [Desulfonatronum thiosulfatophilum]SDB42655.1 aldehyde:ferredoxin oxidoreductase [Desulfonatronum thiosulfatophilum]
MTDTAFRVCIVHLDRDKGEIISFGDKNVHIGGSGLAAALYEKFGLPEEPWSHPDQPLIFAIGCLTGYFPLMSKVVCGFKSPHHDQYSESHAGGRLALAMRFAGYDAIVVRGQATVPVAVHVASKQIETADANYLWGANALTTGRVMRRAFPGASGHRSIIRIGPAGETLSAYACINVDTYRHFGRMGAGSVMGVKKVKAIVVSGDGDQDLPGTDSKAYAKLFKRVYKDMTATEMMSKYHDLGTPGNVTPLNELKSLPIRNLKQTTDPEVEKISGEAFAKDLLIRNTACAGCPVGCIHVGLLREQFQEEHRFQIRQVAYDYELIFGLGSMIGVMDASGCLALMDEVEKEGLDAMSTGVALAWATEAYEKSLLTKEQVEYDLAFGNVAAYKEAIWSLGHAKNEFYADLAKGVKHAAAKYGGEDFACVLGQEMAGYVGETFYASQSLSFRHSHLDTGAYGYDQKEHAKDPEKAVKYLVDDERERVLLTSLVSCLFARGVYKKELLAECLEAVGLSELAGNMDQAADAMQRLRWKVRLSTGYEPEKTTVPKRCMEVETWAGKMNPGYMNAVRQGYIKAIRELGKEEPKPAPESDS